MTNLDFSAPRDLHFRAIEGAPLHQTAFTYFKTHPLWPLCLRREFYDDGATTGDHRHLDFCALYVVRGGRGLHVVDNVAYGITRGDVYLLPPGATHAYRDYRALEIDAFYFPLDLWEENELAALRELAGFWRLMLSGDANRIHLTPETYGMAQTHIEEMRHEYGAGPGAPSLLLRFLLFRFLVFLARHSGAENENFAPKNKRPQLADVLRWCEEHVDEMVSVPQLAAMLFLSPGHFSTLFAREVGMPPAAYLRRLRLEKARALLGDDTLSITQAAQRAGFVDTAHFSRSFKALYGLSPREYRKKK
jgi:AraC-like DNA-binding protein